MEGYDYDAVEIEDITTDVVNRNILRRLKGNDPELVELVVCKRGDVRGGSYCCPRDARDFGWLGYFIGKSTNLRELHLRTNLCQGSYIYAIDSFVRGVNSNRSIQKISFGCMNLMGGEIFQSLSPFFENNNNISEIEVWSCPFGVGCVRQFSSALRSCNKFKSLKTVKLSGNRMGGEQSTEVIEALSTHPQLEKLELWSMSIGRNECAALANVLNSTMTALQELNLYNNNIDDEGVEASVRAVTNNSSLRSLNLSSNRNITTRGYQSLASLLENSNSNLEKLYLNNNNIDDGGALIFANALVNNSKLKILVLNENSVTAEGYSSFSKVLCDASSINNTFLSNHTLEILGGSPNTPTDVASLLISNISSDDKRQVAIKKILKHHRHFDMQPFFEWDLKVLPIANNWFEKARFVGGYHEEAGIDKHKLGAIYQFILAMPEVFEPAPAAGGEKRKRSGN